VTHSDSRQADEPRDVRLVSKTLSGWRSGGSASDMLDQGRISLTEA